MAIFPVVLDSCVLYVAPLRDLLLRLAAAGFYRPHWSAGILDDALRNLLNDGRIRSKDAAERLRNAMTRAFPEAEVVVPPELCAVMTNHPGDRHVLATATVAHAQVIVTMNLKHFPEEALAPWNIQAQPPDEFLLHMRGLSPDGMRHILGQQAQALQNPPLSLEELLEKLRPEAPRFVARVRE